jgi:hypothetical protein
LFAKKLALAAITAAIAAVGVTGVAQGATAGQTCQVNPSSSGWGITVSYWWPSAASYTYYVYYPDSVHITGDYTSWGQPEYYGAYTDGNQAGKLLKTAVNESTCY